MLLVRHKKANYDYEILQTYSAGLVLSGAEVKSLRQKSASLTGSFVQIVDGQAILLNAQISPYPFANNSDYQPNRTRRLLLRKKEIYALLEKLSQKGLTLVPLSIETSGKKIKLIFALARGKKQFEKRAKIRERDLHREQLRQSDY